MGASASKDIRRISFENTFAVTPALALQKVDAPVELDSFSKYENETQQSLFKNEICSNQSLEDGDGDYWGRRIEKLKKEHQIINRIMESEYEQMLQKTQKQYDVVPKVSKEQKIQKLQPCLDLEAKMLKCYEENLRQPLVCSSAVQAFNECVGSSFSHATHATNEE